MGFATLAVLSGLGGGMIRDVLLQQGKPVALTDYAHVLTALGAAALTFLVRVEGRLWDRLWPVVDALALGCWAVAGAQKALDADLGWLPAVLLGTITVAGGGRYRRTGLIGQIGASDRGLVGCVGGRSRSVPAGPLARVDPAQWRRLVAYASCPPGAFPRAAAPAVGPETENPSTQEEGT